MNISLTRTILILVSIFAVPLIVSVVYCIWLMGPIFGSITGIAFGLFLGWELLDLIGKHFTI